MERVSTSSDSISFPSSSALESPARPPLTESLSKPLGCLESPISPSEPRFTLFDRSRASQTSLPTNKSSEVQSKTTGATSLSISLELENTSWLHRAKLLLLVLLLGSPRFRTSRFVSFDAFCLSSSPSSRTDLRLLWFQQMIMRILSGGGNDPQTEADVQSVAGELEPNPTSRVRTRC